MSWKKFNFKSDTRLCDTGFSIGHLKTLCMSVLSLVVALESEWKRYSSSQSDKKKNASKYEFIFRLGYYTKLNWVNSSVGLRYYSAVLHVHYIVT